MCSRRAFSLWATPACHFALPACKEIQAQRAVIKRELEELKQKNDAGGGKYVYVRPGAR